MMIKLPQACHIWSAVGSNGSGNYEADNLDGLFYDCVDAAQS